MKQPVTELDRRFSDQDAVATDWEETRRALEDAELFWISTVRADGRPHVTPLVAVWLDDTIYSSRHRAGTTSRDALPRRCRLDQPRRPLAFPSRRTEAAVVPTGLLSEDDACHEYV
jgi:hypothetical protein